MLGLWKPAQARQYASQIVVGPEVSLISQSIVLPSQLIVNRCDVLAIGPLSHVALFDRASSVIIGIVGQHRTNVAEHMLLVTRPTHWLSSFG